MPYCFDFTFNFYFWLMALKNNSKENTNGKRKEDPGCIAFVSGGLGACPPWFWLACGH